MGRRPGKNYGPGVGHLRVSPSEDRNDKNLPGFFTLNHLLGLACVKTSPHFKVYSGDSVKFVVLFIMLTTHAFGAITTLEKQSALSNVGVVMTEVTGNVEARILYARVTDEIGTKVLVEFGYLIASEGSQKCTYSYDRVLSKVVSGSWGCDK